MLDILSSHFFENLHFFSFLQDWHMVLRLGDMPVSGGSSDVEGMNRPTTAWGARTRYDRASFIERVWRRVELHFPHF